MAIYVQQRSLHFTCRTTSAESERAQDAWRIRTHMLHDTADLNWTVMYCVIEKRLYCTAPHSHALHNKLHSLFAF